MCTELDLFTHLYITKHKKVSFYFRIIFLTCTVGVPYFVKLEKLMSVRRRGNVSRMVKTRNRTRFRSGSDRETFT